jgi:hypothetical protein
METNNAPFYVGQRVVRTGNTNEIVEHGKEYTVCECLICDDCGDWKVRVSGTGTTRLKGQCSCGATLHTKGKYWGRAIFFAPIQPAYESATSEILSKFQPTDEKADKVLKPEKVKL